MTTVKDAAELDSPVQQALSELKALIVQHYPNTTFRVTRSPEDREVILLKPLVDVDDRDEVMDIIIDRLVELQSEQQLPIAVVPVRPKARNEALRQAMERSAPPWRKRLPPIQP